jgi:hypothetical protein
LTWAGLIGVRRLARLDVTDQVTASALLQDHSGADRGFADTAGKRGHLQHLGTGCCRRQRRRSEYLGPSGWPLRSTVTSLRSPRRSKQREAKRPRCHEVSETGGQRRRWSPCPRSGATNPCQPPGPVLSA